MKFSNRISRRNIENGRSLCLPLMMLAVAFPTVTLAQAASTASSSDGTPDQTIIVQGRSSRLDQAGAGLLTAQTAAQTTQSISTEFIAKQVPTQNAQNMLNMLPSANVQAGDPWGLQPGQSYIRGLDSSEVGWIYEGIPLNDPGTASVFIQQYPQAEDLRAVTLRPGTLALDAPTVTATAGTINLDLQDPKHRLGLLVDATIGSESLNREFVRLDTGDIGNTGIRGFIGYSHSYARNWTGPGSVNMHHVDSKFVKDLANGSYVSAVFTYNTQVSNFYRFPTLAQFQAQGNSFAYDSKFTPLDTAYYKLNNNPFRVALGSLPTHFVLSDKLNFDDTPYYYYGSGGGDFGSTLKIGSTYAGSAQVTLDPTPGYPTTPGSTALVEQISYDYIMRGGNTAKFGYALDEHNTITAGWWFQYSYQNVYTRLGQVNQSTGEPLGIWGNQNTLTYNGGTVYDSRNLKNRDLTNAFWIGDSTKYLDDRLKITFGGKYMIANARVESTVPGADQNIALTERRFLPQISGAFQLDHANQVYASVQTTFKTPSPTATIANVYNRNNGSLSQAAALDAKAEHAVSEEIGFRHNGQVVIASISAFHYNFTNRLLTLPIAFGSLAATQTVDAGKQETYGIDAQIGTRPIWFHLRPYLTYEYLDAKIRSDLPVTSVIGGVTMSDYLPTTGKTQISSPKNQAGFGLDYDDSKFFLNGQVKYVSYQFATFMNDQRIPSYISSSISLGYRLPATGPFKAPQVQLNLNNLGNRSALTGVNSFTTNAVATVGRNGGVIAAGQPTYYLLPHFTIAATISSAF